MKILIKSLLLICLMYSYADIAEYSQDNSNDFKQVIISMYLTKDNKDPERIGTITATDTKFGLLLTPNLYNLPEGSYGLRIHENPNCGDQGQLAGGHFDLDNTGMYLGPYSSLGHLGDLPNLYVDKNNQSVIPVLSAKLKVNDILNRSVIIHSKQDEYNEKSYLDSGSRFVCGVIPKKSYSVKKIPNVNIDN